MFGQLLRSALLIALPAIVQGGFSPAGAQTVHAVMFFSPTCQHCHDVINQYLPVLFRTYGGTPGVITDETLPENERSLYLFQNGRLEILLVDASKPVGTELYLASNENQGIPPERSGVPRLVIGDVYLVGSIEIPERTGDLVQQGFDQGGLGWPAVDGLDEAVASVPRMATVVAAEEEDSVNATDAPPSVAVDTTQPEVVSHDTAPTAVEDSLVDRPIITLPTVDVDTMVDLAVEAPPAQAVRDSLTEPGSETQSVADATEPDSAEPMSDNSAASQVEEPSDSPSNVPSVFEGIPTRRLSMLENFRLDPVGNSFSVVVLLLMIVSLVVLSMRPLSVPTSWGLGFGIPVLALIGAFVASYLTYIEATGAIAVCGPVGDCNTVNQSEYAKLFGVLPVGALGLMGYVAIALAWSTSRCASGPVSAWARGSLLAMTVGGTLFSIYLTFLEPFVIGATCAWCLTSSVMITALMWLSAGSGRAAWTRIRDGTA